MQNSEPVPAQALPQSFQFPLASAHCFLVMPSRPPQSAAQPFSFSLPSQTLSPQKGSVLGAFWGLQPAIRKIIKIRILNSFLMLFLQCFYYFNIFPFKMILSPILMPFLAENPPFTSRTYMDGFDDLYKAQSSVLHGSAFLMSAI
jgi:hypothetical protein